MGSCLFSSRADSAPHSVEFVSVLFVGVAVTVVSHCNLSCSFEKKRARTDTSHALERTTTIFYQPRTGTGTTTTTADHTCPTHLCHRIVHAKINPFTSRLSTCQQKKKKHSRNSFSRRSNMLFILVLTRIFIGFFSSAFPPLAVTATSENSVVRTESEQKRGQLLHPCTWRTSRPSGLHQSSSRVTTATTIVNFCPLPQS